jgi:hypothetical protein
MERAFTGQEIRISPGPPRWAPDGEHRKALRLGAQIPRRVGLEGYGLQQMSLVTYGLH